jgi:hypothetical protein
MVIPVIKGVGIIPEDASGFVPAPFGDIVRMSFYPVSNRILVVIEVYGDNRKILAAVLTRNCI